MQILIHAPSLTPSAQKALNLYEVKLYQSENNKLHILKEVFSILNFYDACSMLLLKHCKTRELWSSKIFWTVLHSL